MLLKLYLRPMKNYFQARSASEHPSTEGQEDGPIHSQDPRLCHPSTGARDPGACPCDPWRRNPNLQYPRPRSGLKRWIVVGYQDDISCAIENAANMFWSFYFPILVWLIYYIYELDDNVLIFYCFIIHWQKMSCLSIC